MKHIKNILVALVLILAVSLPGQASANSRRWVLLGSDTIINGDLVAGAYTAEAISPVSITDCIGVRATIEGTVNPSAVGTVSLRINETTLNGAVITDFGFLSRLNVSTGAAIDTGSKPLIVEVDSYPGATVSTATLDHASGFRIWKTFSFLPMDRVAGHVDINLGATGTISASGLLFRLWGYCDR